MYCFDDVIGFCFELHRRSEKRKLALHGAVLKQSNQSSSDCMSFNVFCRGSEMWKTKHRLVCTIDNHRETSKRISHAFYVLHMICMSLFCNKIDMRTSSVDYLCWLWPCVCATCTYNTILITCYTQWELSGAAKFWYIDRFHFFFRRKYGPPGRVKNEIHV